MSFRVSLFLSYLHRDRHRDAFPGDGSLQSGCAPPAQWSSAGGGTGAEIPISPVLGKACHRSQRCCVGAFPCPTARPGPKPRRGSRHSSPLPLFPSEPSLPPAPHAALPGTGIPRRGFPRRRWQRGCLFALDAVWSHQQRVFPFLCQSLPRSSGNEWAGGEQEAQLRQQRGTGGSMGRARLGSSTGMGEAPARHGFAGQRVTETSQRGPLAGHLPVPVVHVLPDERVRCHSAVLVHLRHVHVIDEVDKPPGPGRAVVSP